MVGDSFFSFGGDTNKDYYHLYSGDYNIYQKNSYDNREFSAEYENSGKVTSNCRN